MPGGSTKTQQDKERQGGQQGGRVDPKDGRLAIKAVRELTAERVVSLQSRRPASRVAQDPTGVPTRKPRSGTRTSP